MMWPFNVFTQDAALPAVAAGSIVSLCITDQAVVRVGTNAYGDGVYRACREAVETVGAVQHINLEGEATVRYWHPRLETWRTGTFTASTLTPA